MRRDAQQISFLLPDLSQVAITDESRAEAVGMCCPSCGTPSNQSLICGECGHNLVDQMNSSEFETCGSNETHSHLAESPPIEKSTKNSRLIEFPGVSRNSVPSWRKEIAERVREAQERRAREALAEAQLASAEGADRQLHQLELIPQAEAPPMNPLVAAALKRIERAHIDSPAMAHGSRRSRMAAVAYATESAFPSLAAEPLESPMTTPPTIQSSADFEELPGVEESPVEVEKTHNLVVVPSTPFTVAEQEEPSRNEVKKRRRIISDDPHNPALNYLDSVSTIIHPENVSNRASASRRLIAGTIDLLVVGVLFASFAFGLDLLNPESQNIQTLAFETLSILALGFLYSTVSTAFTGRTLGMKMLSLRVVDARTGLIPTGRQSAGRAFIFNASLLTAGIVLAYVLVDPERRAAHDKITDTAVIQV
jgi:uncharacterized RDD family membrane protein YckC